MPQQHRLCLVHRSSAQNFCCVLTRYTYLACSESIARQAPHQHSGSIRGSTAGTSWLALTSATIVHRARLPTCSWRQQVSQYWFNIIGPHAEGSSTCSSRYGLGSGRVVSFQVCQEFVSRFFQISTIF